MADYTVDQLYAKLERADAAGDTEAAKVIADEIRRVQGTQPAKPDFSDVQSRVGPTVQSNPRQSRGLFNKRDIMLGGRATLEGVGGVLDFVGSPVKAALEYTVGPQQSFTGLAGKLADTIGLPAPESAQERVNSDVARALAGTGATLGVGGALPAGNRLGAFLTAQPGSQVVGSATGAAASGYVRENGGTQGQQLAAGLVGGMAPGMMLSGAQATTRGLIRGGEKGRQQMQQAVDDFASVGATPSVGQATGRRGLQGLESLLTGAPTSNGVMTRFAERQADDIGSGLQSRANAISPNASAERAGRAVEKGAELFRTNSGATKRALYWQADQFIPSNSPVELQNTWGEVVRLTTPNPGAAATTSAMVNPKIASLRQTLEQDLAAGGGKVTYDALKRIRTEIGEALGDYSLVSDTPTREYKALYSALSRDMEAAAQAQGPAAVAAARRANNYTRAVADRMDSLSRVVERNGGPEKVYSAVMSGTRDGGTTLRSVMQSLPVEGQKSITAAVIKRMGLATPGAQDAAGDAFSAATFLTNWNKVSPEARRALFDRYGPEFSKSIDRIARVANTIRDGSRVYANPSGTANKAAAFTYLGSLGGAAVTGNTAILGGLLAGGAISNISARAMTNPKIVRWLAESTRKPTGASIAALQSLAQTDSDAKALLDQLQNPVDNAAN